MSRNALLIAGFCLAGCSAPAWAESQGSAAANAQSALPANAMRLAKLLNPRDKLVEVSVRALEFGFAAQLEKSPEDAAFFDQHPGLDRAVLDAIRPILASHVTAELPRMERRCAEFYVQRFSPAEIDGLIEFYSSSTGDKLIQGMHAGADFGKLMQGLDDTGQPQFTSDHLHGFTRSTVSRILPIFDESDHAYLLGFGNTPLFAKLKRALPEFQQLMAEIANEPTPELDAKIEEAIERAAEQFLRKEVARSPT